VVSACHAAGVCHGDIKPANFLLARKLPRSLHLVPAGARPDDGPWLIAIDFGCAQLAPPMKKLSRRTGTPVYMVRRRYHHLRLLCPRQRQTCGRNAFALNSIVVTEC
jgi:serine/threonine protein kinase